MSCMVVRAGAFIATKCLNKKYRMCIFYYCLINVFQRRQGIRRNWILDTAYIYILIYCRQYKFAYYIFFVFGPACANFDSSLLIWEFGSMRKNGYCPILMQAVFYTLGMQRNKKCLSGSE